MMKCERVWSVLGLSDPEIHFVAKAFVHDVLTGCVCTGAPHTESSLFLLIMQI